METVGVIILAIVVIGISIYFVSRKECPYCKEWIHKDAFVCSRCQRELPKISPAPPSSTTSSNESQQIGRITFIGYLGMLVGILFMFPLFYFIYFLVYDYKTLPKGSPAEMAVAILSFLSFTILGILIIIASYKWARKVPEADAEKKFRKITGLGYTGIGLGLLSIMLGCARYAMDKERFWMNIGDFSFIVFGVLLIYFSYVGTGRKSKQSDYPYSKATNKPDYKKCPFCAEEILAEAIKCKHCGEFLQVGRRE